MSPRNARELQVGHAYLLPVHDNTDLHQVMRDDIIPLISVYCFEDYRVLALILGEDIIDIKNYAPAIKPAREPEAMYRAVLRQISADVDVGIGDDSDLDEGVIDLADTDDSEPDDFGLGDTGDPS